MERASQGKQPSGSGAAGHVPVLAAEVLRILEPVRGETALDCTAGRGGHAVILAERIGEGGTLVLVDLDGDNLAASAARVGALPHAPQVVDLHDNFAQAPRLLVERGLSASLVLADLGVASGHFDDAERGFSFMRPGPLDMRLDRRQPTTAADLVNTLPEAELGQIVRELGEERRWREVARKLVAERAGAPITTTDRLAAIVRSVVAPAGGRGGARVGIDPATRTFQALRIAVNDELGSLRSLLEAVTRAATALAAGAGGRGSWLAPGARIGIVSFHSLEDRLVKQAFSDLVSRGLGLALVRKPVEAGEAEQSSNPRSRSAKFRAVRLAAGPPN